MTDRKPTHPLRLVARLRNNRLLRAREELGLTSAKEAAAALGLAYSTLVEYEGLKRKPFNQETGDWKQSAVAVAAAYGLSCEYLWPEAVRAVKVTETSLEIPAGNVLAMPVPDGFSVEDAVGVIELSAVTKALLEGIPEGQRRVLAAHCQGEPYNDGLSDTRHQQLLAKALRKMRHPSRSKRLKAYAEED